jgi:hypothetical protein
MLRPRVRVDSVLEPNSGESLRSQASAAWFQLPTEGNTLLMSRDETWSEMILSTYIYNLVMYIVGIITSHGSKEFGLKRHCWGQDYSA